ncbi:MAG: signal peptide prediction [Methylocystis sp.]|nr:signal peptide prediction [Methylocystis sp.]MCA3587829.1 signal peptide prediction [Methylocystis sp.]MCA3590839.1 signal peptide prediction [Methylocystis sp.]
MSSGAGSPGTVLRVMGRSEILPEPVQQRACAELPFAIDFELSDSIDGLQRVVSRPDSFDVYHQWHTGDLMWTARGIQAIELDRIVGGREIAVAARTKIGDRGGNGAIFDKLFVQPNGTLGPAATNRIAMLPSLHGVDSFAFHADIYKYIDPDEPQSWSWLFDRRWAARTAILSDPVLGMIEASLATEAHERITFANVGNLTIDEIDLVADLLVRLKRLGRLRRTWRNYQEAAMLMQRGVLVQSMFYPGYVLLQRKGLPVIMSDPIEGMRGWHLDLCISSAATGHVLDAAYAYLNWWHAGWPAACLSRQGYYATFPDQVRQHLTNEEWGYWYGGEPAACHLPDPTGRPAVPIGHRRAGGSHRERMSRVRVWNTFMDEHNYLMRRWREFVTP